VAAAQHHIRSHMHDMTLHGYESRKGPLSSAHRDTAHYCTVLTTGRFIIFKGNNHIASRVEPSPFNNNSYMQAYASAKALNIDFRKTVHAGFAPTTNGSPASLVTVVATPFAKVMNICPKVAMFLTSAGLVTQGGNMRFSKTGMAALAYSSISKAQASIPPNQVASTYSLLKVKVSR